MKEISLEDRKAKAEKYMKDHKVSSVICTTDGTIFIPNKKGENSFAKSHQSRINRKTKRNGEIEAFGGVKPSAGCCASGTNQTSSELTEANPLKMKRSDLTAYILTMGNNKKTAEEMKVEFKGVKELRAYYQTLAGQATSSEDKEEDGEKVAKIDREASINKAIELGSKMSREDLIGLSDEGLYAELRSCKMKALEGFSEDQLVEIAIDKGETRAASTLKSELSMDELKELIIKLDEEGA